MSGPEVAFGVDVGVDDVAVVVFHRAAGGCWQVESAQGPAEEVTALMVAAALPPPKLPEPLAPGPTLADLAWEWTRDHTRDTDMTTEQRDLLRRMYSRQMSTGTLLHVSTAFEPERRPVDNVHGRGPAGTTPDLFRRYYADEVLEAVNAPTGRPHHP